MKIKLEKNHKIEIPVEETSPAVMKLIDTLVEVLPSFGVEAKFWKMKYPDGNIKPVFCLKMCEPQELRYTEVSDE